jgi:hypothetical protein
VALVAGPRDKEVMKITMRSFRVYGLFLLFIFVNFLCVVSAFKFSNLLTCVFTFILFLVYIVLGYYLFLNRQNFRLIWFIRIVYVSYTLYSLISFVMYLNGFD